MKKVRRVWMARQPDLTYNDAYLELQATTRHDWIESKDRRPIDAFERKLSRPSSFFLLDDQERDWRAYSAACLFVENPCGRNARARKRLWLTIKPNNIRPSRGRKWRTRKWVTINGRRIKASVRVSTRQDNRTIASTILWDWSMPLKDQTSRVQRPLLLFINPSLLQGILVAFQQIMLEIFSFKIYTIFIFLEYQFLQTLHRNWNWKMNLFHLNPLFLRREYIRKLQ